MSGHGTNPIFFDQKIKIGRQEHSLILHPSKFKTIHFCLNPPIPMCITPNNKL